MTALRQSLRGIARRARYRVAPPRHAVFKWIAGMNPYQSLLYGAFHGPAAPRGLYSTEDLLALSHRGPGLFLHLHWEQAYLWGTSGPDEAALSHDRYVQAIRNWSANGNRLGWTLHDAEPQTGAEGARVLKIRHEIAARADVVHVHSAAAREHAVEALGVAPDRIVLVEHPSYVTLYPPQNDPAREAERRNGRRLLYFGNIRPYKNYGALADALAALPAGGFRGLTIAGGGPASLLPVDRLREATDLELRLKRVPEAEVPALFQAADFMVLPYSVSMTSGVAMLAMGFGVPVIAPDIGGFRATAPAENAALIYDADAPSGLAGALAAARDMPDETYRALRQACFAFADALHPDIQSKKLLAALQARGLVG